MAIEFRNLKKLAEKGDVQAQYQLGELSIMYSKYKGIKWLKKASKQHHIQSQILLGSLRYSQLRYTDALFWYKKAAASHDITAIIKVGEIYEFDLENKIETVNWYKKNIGLLNNNTIHNLGVRLHNKDYDLEDVIFFLEHAANNDYVASQFILGKIYSKTDEEKSFFWYKKSAENDFMDSQLHLGLYYHGKGDFENAIFWLTKASDQNCVFSQYYLGKLYLEKNQEENARYWLNESANNGNINAILLLQKLDKEDEFTFGLKHFFEYFNACLESNKPSAKYCLGKIFSMCNNIKESKEYFLESSNKGFERSKQITNMFISPEENKSECCVCLDEGKVCKLKCNHSLCETCLFKINVSETRKCPMCRTSFN